MKNKKWFTLVEVLLSLLIVWLFIGIVMWIYTSIRKTDWKIANKRVLTAEASDLIDRIHEAAIDYNIDYEEYFNRKILWFWPDGSGFSTYGNSGQRYYCWDRDYESNGGYSIKARDTDWWCEYEWNQKYGEYYFQHRKLTDLENLNSSQNSWGNMKNWPIAISPNTWLEYLYLISPNWTERYYFRRIFKTWVDLDGIAGFSWKNESLYIIQMLKLKWFDAWQNHDFKSRWAFDGFIDTRACDYSQWFSCKGTEVITWYKLPVDFDDWRVDITSRKVTVNDFKIDIYPNKDPYLATKDTDNLYDPYIKISFTMNMYGQVSSEEITLSTTLSLKNSYSKFFVAPYTWYVWDQHLDI